MDERDFLFYQNEESSESSSSDGSNYEGSSSSSSSSKFDMMDIDDTIDEAMQMAVSLLWRDLEGGLEDATIRWRQRHEGLLICEISEDDAIAHFRFRKPHLQELSDMLWPRLHQFLPGAGSPTSLFLRMETIPLPTKQ